MQQARKKPYKNHPSLAHALNNYIQHNKSWRNLMGKLTWGFTIKHELQYSLSSEKLLSTLFCPDMNNVVGTNSPNTMHFCMDPAIYLLTINLDLE